MDHHIPLPVFTHVKICDNAGGLPRGAERPVEAFFFPLDEFDEADAVRRRTGPLELGCKPSGYVGLGRREIRVPDGVGSEGKVMLDVFVADEGEGESFNGD